MEIADQDKLESLESGLELFEGKAVSKLRENRNKKQGDKHVQLREEPLTEPQTAVERLIEWAR